MKILYGVQGTGNGHITRARALSKAFKKRNVDVDYLFSGRPAEKYFDMEPFPGWQSKTGLTFHHNAGKIDTLETLKRNRVGQFIREVRNLDLSPYDLIVTDFEPTTAWAGKLQKKTVIGVGHQYAFKFPVPLQGDNFVTRALIRHFAPANIGLGLHWHHFEQPILPPIADIPDRNETMVQPKKILVYLGFENADAVMTLLEPFSNYEFYYYGEFTSAEKRGHIHLRPLSREGFKRDLADCTGVICNAGFELASEAIEMGKKLLVKPLKGQMEQLSNAKALEQLQLGMTMDVLDPALVSYWLQQWPNKQVHYPDVADAIVDWIMAGDWTEDARDRLVTELWQNVSFSTQGNSRSIVESNSRQLAL